MIFQRIFQAVLITVFLMIVAGIFIRVYPFEEYQLKKQPYTVLTKEVETGGSLQVEVDYCKLSNASGEVTLIWEGPSRKIVPIGKIQLNKGCIKTIITYPVPTDLIQGEYTLTGHGEYEKFLVGKAKIDTVTEQFAVIQN